MYYSDPVVTVWKHRPISLQALVAMYLSQLHLLQLGVKTQLPTHTLCNEVPLLHMAACHMLGLTCTSTLQGEETGRKIVQYTSVAMLARFLFGLFATVLF